MHVVPAAHAHRRHEVRGRSPLPPPPLPVHEVRVESPGGAGRELCTGGVGEGALSRQQLEKEWKEEVLHNCLYLVLSAPLQRSAMKEGSEG